MKNKQRIHKSLIPFVDLDLQSQSSLFVKQIEKTVDSVDDDEPSHRHNFHEIFWIRSGSGTQSVDDQFLEILPHTFYLVTQGQIHEFIEGHELNGLIIQFSTDYLFDLPADQSWITQAFFFGNVAAQNTISVAKSEINDFEILLDQIQKEYLSKNSLGKNHVLRYLLNILLIRLQRKHKDQFERNSLYSDRIGTLHLYLQIIEKYFRERHQVSQYTGELAVTSRQLTEITKSILGKTAKEIILERLILEAKRYLRFSPLSVKEIAYDLGFDDPSYFSKQFKLITSQSPLNFRKNA